MQEVLILVLVRKRLELANCLFPTRRSPLGLRS